MPESFTYKRAIAYLAQRIVDGRKTKSILTYNRLSGRLHDNQLDLWEAAQALCPELRLMAKDVEAELNYELSYSQCCNAVKWACIYDPAAWAHLLVKESQELTKQVQ